MNIDAHLSIITTNDEELTHVKQTLTSALTDITAPNGNHSIVVNALSVEQVMTAIKSSPVFLDEDRLSLIDALMNELNLSSARITFYPTPEWGYGLLTDQGIEYFGSLNLYTLQEDLTANVLKHLPTWLLFLALIGPDPSDSLLARFRTYQLIWIGLRDDVNREMFFTQDNIAGLWQNPESASQFFIADRSTALKLAGYIS
jgi:hypothetical protein